MATLTLNVRGEKFVYTSDDLKKLKCDYIDSIDLKDGSVEETLDFDPLHFKLVIEYLKTGEVFSTNKNKDKLVKIASYLGINSYMVEQSTDVGVLYTLKEEDYHMRKEESMKRIMLKSIEEKKDELYVKGKDVTDKVMSMDKDIIVNDWINENAYYRKVYDNWKADFRGSCNFIKSDGRYCETGMSNNKCCDTHQYLVQISDQKCLKCIRYCLPGRQLCMRHLIKEYAIPNTHTINYDAIEDKEVREMAEADRCKFSRCRRPGTLYSYYCYIHRNTYRDPFKFENADYHVIGNIKEKRICNMELFKLRFNRYKLSNILSPKLIAAGGACFKSLDTDGTFSSFYDCDLFLVTRDETEATKLIEKVHKHFKLQYSGLSIIRTINSITFNLDDYYSVQIILRLYHNITHVISGFDIDSCCIAYDGTNVYAMPRFLRSMKKGYNIADPERQSENYSERLHKYKYRGIGIAMPGLDLKRMHASIHIHRVKKKGLARIICMNRALHDTKSDYENVSDIPKYICKKIHKHIRKELDKYNEIGRKHCDEWVDLTEKTIWGSNLIPSLLEHTDINVGIMVNTNMSKIFRGGEFYYKDYRLVADPIKFVTKDAASQESVNGSFKPVFDDWFKDLYEG